MLVVLLWLKVGTTITTISITTTIPIDAAHWWKMSNQTTIIHHNSINNRGAHLWPSGTTTRIITTTPHRIIYPLMVTNTNRVASCNRNNSLIISIIIMVVYHNTHQGRWRRAHQKKSGRIITSHTVLIRILTVSLLINCLWKILITRLMLLVTITIVILTTITITDRDITYQLRVWTRVVGIII